MLNFQIKWQLCSASSGCILTSALAISFHSSYNDQLTDLRQCVEQTDCPDVCRHASIDESVHHVDLSCVGVGDALCTWNQLPVA